MFRVPPSIQAERLKICKGCKFYAPETKSCGPLIVGRKLTDEERAEVEEKLIVKRKNSKVRLCGCHMPTKTKLIFSKCPAGFWDSYRKMTNDEREHATAFILRIKKLNVLKWTEVEELYRIAAKITGTRKDPSTCTSCVVQMMQDVERALTED